jgi:MYXO-CTERM domain-containing protein
LTAVLRHALLILPLALLGCGEESASRPLHEGRLQSELRPTDTATAQMWRYETTDVVERHDTDAGFRVHYTRAGKNAVRATDADDSGVPDFVEAVGGVYGEVAAKYQGQMGFRAPVSDATVSGNGGDGRFDVYLLDFALSADGAFRTDQCLTSPETCIGYVVQENDFAGYAYPSATAATRILGSHEYFHAIQDAYDHGQGVVLSEGTAVWATEQVYPATSDLEDFVGGYLSRTDRSLDSPPPGPVPSFAYGSAIFFQFLSEKYGPDLVRHLWERCENGQGHPSVAADVADPKWMVQLDALLAAEHQTSFARAFREFSTWNFYLSTAADPAKSYANGAAYPGVTATTSTAPVQLFPMRVYYASAQYFRVAAAGRASMTAALVDDPATADDDTRSLALLVAVRRAGRVVELADFADLKSGAQTVDSSGTAEVLVAVVNTAREGEGAVLSRRPGLCIGTPREVALCHAALDPAFDAGVEVADAGAPDAGAADAGSPDAGTGEPPLPPAGCGCAASGDSSVGTALLLAGALLLLARRRVGTSGATRASRSRAL